MKAIAIEEFGGPEKLEMLELPPPNPEPDEVLVKVHYAGVNPVDWKIREGWLKKMFAHDFPVILGWDAAGTVEAVGEGVTGLKEGDAVYTYCRKPTIGQGTFAEYITMQAQHVAPKPENLSFAEAAAIPLVGLTAWQALFDFADLRQEQSVLIHAGAGGVGSLAIQLAKDVKAFVLTTASERNGDYVKSLGADVFIDYTQEDFALRVKDNFPEGVDVVFDCVGGKTLEKSWNCVRQGGCLVTIVDFNVDPERGKEAGIHAGSVFVAPNGEQLRMLTELFEAGKLQAPNIQEYDFEEVGKALDDQKQGHTRGKNVIKVLQ